MVYSSYYLYGKHSALAALQNPNRKILEAFCTIDFYQNNNQIISPHQPQIVQEHKLQQLLGKENLVHQGVVLNIKPLYSSKSNDLHQKIAIDLNQPNGKNCKMLMLDQITDVQNIGAIIRSAAAFNIKYITALEQRGGPIENGAIAKAASGALESVNLATVVNLVSEIEKLKKMGFWIIGLDSNTNQYVTKDVLKHYCSDSPICIILGSEGTGIRPLIKKHCDLLLQIKMNKDSVTSLNVSNAAAIISYILSTIE